MKIIHISDTHRQLSKIEIPPCDVLIHTGDDDVNSLIDIIRLSNWFSKQPAKLRLFIPGNHDWLFEIDYNLAKSNLTEATLLLDSSIEYKGVKFYGSPWQPEFNSWAFNLPRGKALKAKWDLIPNDTDFLLTHSPPYGILDKVLYTNEHVGCEELIDAVERIKPLYHLFGHIHEGYGNDKLFWYENMKNTGKKTIFLNSAQVNEDYKLVNKPQVIEI